MIIFQNTTNRVILSLSPLLVPGNRHKKLIFFLVKPNQIHKLLIYK